MFTATDRNVQGSLSDDWYRFWHWWQVDTFVYFSHHLVTIPPVCWIDAGHRHSVAVLGLIWMQSTFSSLLNSIFDLSS